MSIALFYSAIALIGIFISIQIFSLIFIIFKENKPFSKFDELPFVSVLLAARNEENTIERCIKAFEEIDYPPSKIEFLIGNDDSNDHTREIVLQLIAEKPNFRIIDIYENIGKSAGKANVLAQLSNIAIGEFYFITDCDVAVSKYWIKSLLNNFDENVGIVSGTTTCNPGNFFANLQTMDWLHFMGYIKSFANAGISCTSVGNNMAVRANAYKQTGGYENIDFSITEDYKLFSEVTKQGWQWRNILDSDSLGLATYISPLSELFHQRKRWLIGARDLPLNWKAIIIIYGLFLPALFILLFIHPLLGLLLWIIKFGIQSMYIKSLLIKTGLKFDKGILFYLIYEIYLYLITLSTIVFYFLPFKSVWKGRKYRRGGLS